MTFFQVSENASCVILSNLSNPYDPFLLLSSFHKPAHANHIIKDFSKFHKTFQGDILYYLYIFII
jgi:hypothetical protein